MTQTIEITIYPTGETKIETKGFEGSSCRDASQLLETALGAKLEERLTPEFYQDATQSQSLREGQ